MTYNSYVVYTAGPMQTKLTLRLDEEQIARAKTWAKRRGISLSQAVASFFDQLPSKKSNPDLDPWTRRLLGAARGRGPAPTDEEVRQGYIKYLEKKYK